MRIRTLTTMFLLVCAVAVPASASANIGSVPDSNQSGGDPDHYAGIVTDSSQSGGNPDYTSVNSIVPPASVHDSSTAPSADSSYSSVSAIAGPPADTPAFVSGSPGSGEGFDWPSALVGAGTALALAALGTAAMLTARRRTAISPSASAS